MFAQIALAVKYRQDKNHLYSPTLTSKKIHVTEVDGSLILKLNQTDIDAYISIADAMNTIDR